MIKLSIEKSKLMVLRSYNTDLDEIILTFTDQSCKRVLEMENKINLALLISKQK